MGKQNEVRREKSSSPSSSSSRKFRQKQQKVLPQRISWENRMKFGAEEAELHLKARHRNEVRHAQGRALPSNLIIRMKFGATLRRIGVRGVEIRKPEQLDNVDGLIIPGGESTTMAKLANYHNLFPAMREFVSTGKPVWGTCAGLILLANKAVGQKLGGQEVIGGLDCTVHRNFFGSQLESFETLLSVPQLAEKEGGPDSCRGVFIRAPAILEVGPDVEVLADCPVPSDNARTIICAGEGKKERVIVAVRQGNLLGTAFHPELTSDSRWHSFFLKMGKETGERSLECVSAPEGYLEDCQGKRAFDLPIFQ
ncbi:putative pyridoxal 5'-phosphate synthase subunit PDX2 [Cocos nucifera]|nr:putative pyridoxal 5'-phosphate synthase subunit PDX2 [Cocos nucifera]